MIIAVLSKVIKTKKKKKCTLVRGVEVLIKVIALLPLASNTSSVMNQNEF